MRRGRGVVAAIAVALAAAGPAAAQAPCTADFPATAPAPMPGARQLNVGIYPGGPAGQLGPVPAGAKPEDQAKIFEALGRLRPPEGPLAVHLYRAYLDDETDAKEEREHRRLVDLYTERGYGVEIVIRYRRDNDPGGFADFVRGVVRRFGSNRLVVGFQVTNEVNFTASPDSSDGAYAGARDALIQGVIAAKDEARSRGYAHLDIGFNWVYRTDPGNERSFWEYLGTAGGERFVKSLDWVGLDAYPGTFFPPRAEPSSAGEFMVNALSSLRKCNMPMAGIPDSVPIHIEENGYPTGPDRSYEDQRVAAEAMLRAVDDYAAVYNVTTYFWFDLRDADSSSPNFQQQYGVMRDDYTPKPAFEVLRSWFARVSVKTATSTRLHARCYSRGVYAYLTDAGPLSRVVFSVGNKRGTDGGSPFRRHLRLGARRPRGLFRVKAVLHSNESKPVALVRRVRC